MVAAVDARGAVGCDPPCALEPHRPPVVEILVSPPGRFKWDGSWFGWEGATLFDRYAGTAELRNLIDGGATPEAVVASFARDEETWRRARARYLIYS